MLNNALTKSHNKYKKDNEKETGRFVKKNYNEKICPKIKENNDNNNVVLKMF